MKLTDTGFAAVVSFPFIKCLWEKYKNLKKQVNILKFPFIFFQNSCLQIIDLLVFWWTKKTTVPAMMLFILNYFTGCV